MMRSQVLDVDGPVHYMDYGGSGSTMVLVHGLGGSHLNWLAAAPGLARHHRVLAPDLAGFGLTPLSARKASIETNVKLVDGFIDTVSPGEPVTLVGNSMGGLIAMIEAADAPDKVATAVLVTPALAPVSGGGMEGSTALRLAIPTLPWIGPKITERYQARVPLERQIEETFDMLCVDPSLVPQAVRSASLEMARLRQNMAWTVPAFVDASRSIGLLLARRKRFLSMIHRISCPVLVVHGEQDEIVPVASARWLQGQRPDFEFSFFQDAGHIPHIERAEEFVTEVESFLQRVPA